MHEDYYRGPYKDFCRKPLERLTIFSNHTCTVENMLTYISIESLQMSEATICLLPPAFTHHKSEFNISMDSHDSRTGWIICNVCLAKGT